MKYQQFKEDKLGLRDHLALDRTAMANERTFLAYARTAIMVIATAVTLYKLFAETSSYIPPVAIALALVALVIAFAGVRRYVVLSKALKEIKN